MNTYDAAIENIGRIFDEELLRAFKRMQTHEQIAYNDVGLPPVVFDPEIGKYVRQKPAQRIDA